MIATAVKTEQSVHQGVIEVTEKEVIKRLRGYALERRRAIEYYPHAKGASEKLNVIDETIATLDSADQCLSVKQALIKVLSVRSSLHFIAPTATRKLHATWYTKIEKLMDGCRAYLGWTIQ